LYYQSKIVVCILSLYFPYFSDPVQLNDSCVIAKVFQGEKYFADVATLTGSQELMKSYSKMCSALP